MQLNRMKNTHEITMDKQKFQKKIYQTQKCTLWIYFIWNYSFQHIALHLVKKKKLLEIGHSMRYIIMDIFYMREQMTVLSAMRTKRKWGNWTSRITMEDTSTCIGIHRYIFFRKFNNNNDNINRDCSVRCGRWLVFPDQIYISIYTYILFTCVCFLSTTIADDNRKHQNDIRTLIWPFNG